MLCESCNEREATIHLTQVIEGAVKKLHLCEVCAAKSGFDIQSPMSITDILLGMGGKTAEPAEGELDRACPRCHLRRADFKKSGRLGCPECYEAFADELLPLIKVMHRGDQHKGKIPSRECVRVKMTAEMATLRQALEKAVREENYEEAALLRDRIQECKKKSAESEGGEAS